MTVEIVVESVLAFILSISILNLFIITVRGVKVTNFRIYLVNKIYIATYERIIKDNNLDIYKFYNIYNNVSYNKMLYSFKALKVENFYKDEEFIKLIEGE